jgi:catechol 2,3-dioxygenase-like lactoylglutathione lyase family enzyme
MPGLAGILETSLYFQGGRGEEVGRFYRDVLGLREVGAGERMLVYRLGSQVVLLFDAELTARAGGPLPEHGATGSGHVCFVVAGAEYGDWKRRLAERGVEVLAEKEWSGEIRSFYFRDPAGNLLEIADGDLWPP